MNYREMKFLIVEDMAALDKPSFKNFVKYLICNASFKITFWYRVLNWLKDKKVMRLVYFVIYFYYKHLSYLTGIQLPVASKMGGGIRFAHFSCIVINENVICGKSTVIFQGVTIGGMRGKGCPKIGNNCVIAAGAKIIGNVTIGNNVFVGANAVVTKNIEDNAVVVGIPAKIISHKGKEYTSLYIRNQRS